MNVKGTIVQADSAYPCGRVSSLHLSMNLREPRKRGLLVINRGGDVVVSDENGWKYTGCQAGL